MAGNYGCVTGPFPGCGTGRAVVVLRTTTTTVFRMAPVAVAVGA